MKRHIPSTLLAVSLLTAACGGPSPEEIAEASEAFGPVVEDVAIAAPTTTAPAASDDDTPEEIAFEEEAQDSSSSSDEGICVVIDDVLDRFFDPAQIDELQQELGTDGGLDDLLLELDDGPFGAEWHRFFEAFVEAEEGSSSALAEFDRDWAVATDQLAVDQCGYPVFTTFITAISPNCLEPIDDDGSRGELVCTPQPDPR